MATIIEGDVLIRVDYATWHALLSSYVPAGWRLSGLLFEDPHRSTKIIVPPTIHVQAETMGEVVGHVIETQPKTRKKK